MLAVERVHGRCIETYVAFLADLRAAGASELVSNLLCLALDHLQHPLLALQQVPQIADPA
jgi:hypothetical protein